jgi:hypothetical protein
MHKLKLIPLFISNFGNFIVRFFTLLLKKKARPSLVIHEEPDKDERNYYDIHPKLMLSLKNGLILKINKTYIPIRRNEMSLRLNLVDFSGDFIHFKLIGVLQNCNVSIPINNPHLVELNQVDTNKILLIDEIQSKGVTEASIKETEIGLRLNTANMILAFEAISMQPREIELKTFQIAIRLGLNEVEEELNLKNTINIK